MPGSSIQGGANAYNWQISNGYGPGQVTGITMTAAGEKYASTPLVTFDPAPTGGKTATGLAMMGLQITVSGGANYKTAPTVAFGQPAVGGGTQAMGFAVLGTGSQAGQVVAVTVTNYGSGYASAPTLKFTTAAGDSGSGASATVSFDGTVSGIAITSAGYGYPTTTPPMIKIGDGTQATATATLGDLQEISPAALNTVYDFYKDKPELLAAMFNDPLYQDVALPKLSEAFYWPLQWNDFNTTNSTDGTKTAQQAIATFSIESLNRSNTFDASGNFTGPARTSLDSKYQSDANLSVPNTLGGTFAGLSSLSYENFVTFLNTAATIIAEKRRRIPTARPPCGRRMSHSRSTTPPSCRSSGWSSKTPTAGPIRTPLLCS